MKRFLLFAGDTFYSEGGWVDFRQDFELFGDAQQAGEKLLDIDANGCREVDWFHVVDLNTAEIVFSRGERLGD